MYAPCIVETPGRVQQKFGSGLAETNLVGIVGCVDAQPTKWRAKLGSEPTLKNRRGGDRTCQARPHVH